MIEHVDIEIGEAVVTVSSETIKDRIIVQSLLSKLPAIINCVETELGVTDNDYIQISAYNYCVFSARLKVKSGKLPFKLLTPSDDEKALSKKVLEFINLPYDNVYQSSVDLINRIDAPDDDELAPGAIDQYKELSADDFDNLPDEEKKS